LLQKERSSVEKVFSQAMRLHPHNEGKQTVVSSFQLAVLVSTSCRDPVLYARHCSTLSWSLDYVIHASVGAAITMCTGNRGTMPFGTVTSET